MTFKELREQSGMSRTQFAEYFGIPYRTVQDWELGNRECKDYLIELMEYKLKHREKHGHCGFCEDYDRMNEVVCYLPNNNGGATDVPLNFCPCCGADLEGGGEDG